MNKLIYRIRTYLNMNQTEFAERLNVTFATVNRWENGRALPTKLAQTMMFELCKELNVPVYDMIIRNISDVAKELKVDTNRVVLYHGSKSGIEGNIEPKSREFWSASCQVDKRNNKKNVWLNDSTIPIGMVEFLRSFCVMKLHRCHTF